MIKFLFIILFVFLIYFFKKMFKSGKISKHLFNIINIFLIVLICEFSIFNINSYRLSFSKYVEKQFFNESFKLINLTSNHNNTYIMDSNEAYIEIKANTKVGTIYLDAKSGVNPVEYSVLYTDKTSANFRELPSKVLVNSIKISKYTTCYLSGNSKRIRIKLSGNRGNIIKINSIKINHPVPFNFNIIRVLFISLFFIVIYIVKNFDVFKTSYNDNKKFALKMTVFVTILFMILIIFIGGKATYYNMLDTYSDDFAQSIIDGDISLGDADKELLSLDNPYDFTVRKGGGFREDWDMALYNKKYYMYFGILPELILFVPYLYFTKSSLPIGIGVTIFSLGVIISLSILLFKILKYWFSNLPLKLWLLCQVILLSGATIFNLVGRPLVYENAIASALFFSASGMIFAFNFFICNSKKYRDLLLSCILLSLSVACRPTALLISLIIIPLVIHNLIQNKNNRSDFIKTLLCVVIPYLIVGISLMIYNYIRFNNPFEFGANYQITVNDYTNLKYRIMTIPVGIYTAFFKIPSYISTFPFFKTSSETINFFGYFYTEDNIGGLFILVPTTIAIFYLPKMKDKFKDRKKKYLVFMFTLVAIISAFLSITSAGVLQRYLADYSWLFIISSIIIILSFYEKLKSEEAKTIIIKIISACAIFTFFINFLTGGIIGEKNLMKFINPDTFYYIRYLVCFWE